MERKITADSLHAPTPQNPLVAGLVALYTDQHAAILIIQIFQQYEAIKRAFLLRNLIIGVFNDNQTVPTARSSNKFHSYN